MREQKEKEDSSRFFFSSYICKRKKKSQVSVRMQFYTSKGKKGHHDAAVGCFLLFLFFHR